MSQCVDFTTQWHYRKVVELPEVDPGGELSCFRGIDLKRTVGPSHSLFLTFCSRSCGEWFSFADRHSTMMQHHRPDIVRTTNHRQKPLNLKDKVFVTN
jgi:hypothetical protein